MSKRLIQILLVGIAIIGLVMFSKPEDLHGDVEPVSAVVENAPVVIDKDYIDSRVDYYASYWGADASVMRAILRGETKYHQKVNPQAIGDMNLTCKRTGMPVRARGLVQITECWFPEVTDEQAFDIEFSLNFLAKHLSEGKCQQLWSTCPYK